MSDNWYRLGGPKPPAILTAHDAAPIFYTALRTELPDGSETEALTHSYNIATKTFVPVDASRLTIVSDPFSMSLDGVLLIAVISGVLATAKFLQGGIVGNPEIRFYMRTSTTPVCLVTVNGAGELAALNFTETGASITDILNKMCLCQSGVPVATIGADGLIVTSLLQDFGLLITHLGEEIITDDGSNLVI